MCRMAPASSSRSSCRRTSLRCRAWTPESQAAAAAWASQWTAMRCAQDRLRGVATAPGLAWCMALHCTSLRMQASRSTCCHVACKHAAHMQQVPDAHMHACTLSCAVSSKEYADRRRTSTIPHARCRSGVEKKLCASPRRTGRLWSAAGMRTCLGRRRTASHPHWRP